MKIVEELDRKDGVVLAKREDGMYCVGIGYSVGFDLSPERVNSFVDFCITPNEEIARRQFELKTGGSKK